MSADDVVVFVTPRSGGSTVHIHPDGECPRLRQSDRVRELSAAEAASRYPGAPECGWCGAEASPGGSSGGGGVWSELMAMDPDDVGV